MKDLSVFRYGFFFHANPTFVYNTLGHCPYCTQMVLLGIRRWTLFVADTCQVGCLRPRLVLVLQTPLLRGSTTVLRSEGQVRHLFPSTLGGVFPGEVVVRDSGT